MAKKVVRYLLEGNGQVPAFVEDGGYWSVGAELVGLSVDEDTRHVPATVVRMSRADLSARLEAMEMRDPASQELLDAEAKEAMLDAWLLQIGMSDLA